MRIVIVNPANYGRGESGLRPPFGLLTLYSGLKSQGAEVQWLDADLLRSKTKTANALAPYLDYDLMMIGGLSTAYRSIKEVISYVESTGSEIKILVGGRVAKDSGDIVWEFNPRLDMLCRQEGEYVIKDILQHWPDVSEIRGIEYRKGNDIVVNESAPVPTTFDEVPMIDWDVLDDAYFQTQGFLLTGRGCPFKCLFCRRKDSTVEKHRGMCAEAVMSEIRYLLDVRKVQRITFVDEFFMQDKQRVELMCNTILENNLNFTWVCTTRANIIDEDDLDLLRLMKKSGCIAINMGLESGSQVMLENMGKKLRIEQSEKALATIRKAGLKIRPTFIFGFPGETRETALESIRWRKKWGLPGKFFYATPFPGSELYVQWVKKSNMGLAEQEEWLMQDLSLINYNINLTDMPDWKLRLLGIECAIRLDYKTFIRKRMQSVKRKAKRILTN